MESHAPESVPFCFPRNEKSQPVGGVPCNREKNPATGQRGRRVACVQPQGPATARVATRRPFFRLYNTSGYVRIGGHDARTEKENAVYSVRSGQDYWDHLGEITTARNCREASSTNGRSAGFSARVLLRDQRSPDSPIHGQATPGRPAKDRRSEAKTSGL